MNIIRTRLAFLTLVAALQVPAAPVAYADPPPWAPAHGWRKKHDPYYLGYSGRKWEQDYGVIDGRCNREAIGTVLGGIAGGAIGSTVGKGDGKTVAILLGTVLGAVIGNKIGRDMDNADRGCIGHALELVPNRQSVAWDGSDGLNYRITPLRDYTANGLKCREYRLRVRGEGLRDDRREKACLAEDGNWQVVGRD